MAEQWTDGRARFALTLFATLDAARRFRILSREAFEPRAVRTTARPRHDRCSAAAHAPICSA